MKFEYCKEMGAGFPVYHFRYTLDEDDVRKVLHKYSYPPEWMSAVFDTFQYSPSDNSYKIGASLRILQDALCDEDVDLGTNYKAKYEELAKLLEPHKLEDDMEPATTLKMILKYGK
jgi:hypothetical protein